MGFFPIHEIEVIDYKYIVLFVVQIRYRTQQNFQKHQVVQNHFRTAKI